MLQTNVDQLNFKIVRLFQVAIGLNNFLAFSATMGMIGLTHSCLVISLTSVIFIYHSIKNNLGFKCTFAKYLNKSC